MNLKGAGKKKKAVVVLTITVIALMCLTVFYYTNEAYLTLAGDKTVSIGLNGVYEEKGVEARISGRDVSDRVKITGKVDTSVPGTYTLKYKAGNFTAERVVKVSEKMSPELILKGEEEIRIGLGEEFEEPGYSAVDEKGNDISSEVQVSNTSFKKAGKHQVTYTVKNESGSKTRLARDVIVEPNTEYDAAGLPICMYHYVFDENNPPEDVNSRYGNYISMQDLEEELNWLNEEQYYYPDWQEVKDYIDGKLILPDKSIVLCFDDGADSFLENGIPVLEKCKVPATCFMITSYRGISKIEKYKSRYVSYQSHSHNMHRGGGYIGHGGIFTAIPQEEGMEDLEKSIEICGSSDAFAYPYGDYDERCRQMVEDAGFMCALTTQYGKAYPGDDPLLLPRIRMVQEQSLDEFISKVEPETQEN